MNSLISVAFLIATVVAAVLGNLVGAAVLLGFAVIWVGVARYARSPRASEQLRISNFEYRDANDRSLASRAFAGVGMVALTLSGFDVIGMLVTGHQDMSLTLRFVVLAAAFSIALANALEKEHPEP
ncbi:hypothetical protein KIV56_00095 [Cryobacterium breve]|uniref:DUF3784 domain-containing protein n=1 Tax=Cryobacterium breve TaxID=1259258 RepID=A0ABY7NC25_9MICO|nr:hypothetical protein [Cryobacterium breve]WBM80060.1 hypothetical protein KIV56_18375 [Cryobacterium breve]WBM80071.1 hypothetical protein KIV56_00095 [Cryobacterium breve]